MPRRSLRAAFPGQQLGLSHRAPAVASTVMAPSGAMCAKHPQANAIGACSRCGSFMCISCAQGGLCEACRARLPASEFAACPACQAQSASRLNFTWWGGALGPRLLTHVKCGSCGVTYNGKTGRSNNGAIAAYIVIVNVVLIGLLLALGLLN
ncbi:MAG: hypothetical protein AB1938_13745 [Myxococcota bacterium]